MRNQATPQSAFAIKAQRISVIMSQALFEQTEEQPLADDRWGVLQTEKNGKPLLVRYRTQRPQAVEAAAFPFLLSATWAYQANEAGFPTPAELELMDKFEDAL